MERVDHPSKVEMIPGEPWTKRVKYTEVAELISDYEASNASIGRTFCPVLNYMRDHAGDPLEEVEAHIYSHPEWGPTALCETMHKTLAFNNDGSELGAFIAGWVQHFCVLELAKHPPERVRHPLSEMLKHDDMRFMSRDALYCVLALVCACHPNPKRFLSKPEVLAKLPTWLDLTNFPCPDFPELSHSPLAGKNLGLP
jgi:hypothetical protein